MTILTDALELIIAMALTALVVFGGYAIVKAARQGVSRDAAITLNLFCWPALVVVNGIITIAFVIAPPHSGIMEIAGYYKLASLAVGLGTATWASTTRRPHLLPIIAIVQFGCFLAFSAWLNTLCCADGSWGLRRQRAYLEKLSNGDVVTLTLECPNSKVTAPIVIPKGEAVESNDVKCGSGGNTVNRFSLTQDVRPKLRWEHRRGWHWDSAVLGLPDDCTPAPQRLIIDGTKAQLTVGGMMNASDPALHSSHPGILLPPLKSCVTHDNEPIVLGGS